MDIADQLDRTRLPIAMASTFRRTKSTICLLHRKTAWTMFAVGSNRPAFTRIAFPSRPTSNGCSSTRTPRRLRSCFGRSIISTRIRTLESPMSPAESKTPIKPMEPTNPSDIMFRSRSKITLTTSPRGLSCLKSAPRSHRPSWTSAAFPFQFPRFSGN